MFAKFSQFSIMNAIQSEVFEAIMALASIPGFESLYEKSHFRYGFLNYIAKYSLARDTYLATDSALEHILQGKFLDSLGRLRRGLKCRKNGFTYEHPVPSNVIGAEIAKSEKSRASVSKILSWSDCIVILTSKEDSLLRESGYGVSQVNGWKYFESSQFSRYFASGICSIPPTVELEMYGSVIR